MLCLDVDSDECNSLSLDSSTATFGNNCFTPVQSSDDFVAFYSVRIEDSDRGFVT